MLQYYEYIQKKITPGEQTKRSKAERTTVVGITRKTCRPYIIFTSQEKSDRYLRKREGRTSKKSQVTFRKVPFPYQYVID